MSVRFVPEATESLLDELARALFKGYCLGCPIEVSPDCDVEIEVLININKTVILIGSLPRGFTLKYT